MDGSCGVVYGVFGKPRYYRQVVASAKSVKQHSPNLSICLLTDKSSGAQADMGKFLDHIVPYQPPPDEQAMRYKIDALRASPYDYTLLLDTDVHACGDIEPMFEVLETYDFAVAANPRMLNPRWEPSGVPYWFPEPSNGVILARRTEMVGQLLEDWEGLYAELGEWSDQRSGRIAMYHAVQAGLQLYWLPCNCHVWVGEGTGQLVPVGGRAYILHGRGWNPAKVCRQINASTARRVYRVGHGFLHRGDCE